MADEPTRLGFQVVMSPKDAGVPDYRRQILHRSLDAALTHFDAHVENWPLTHKMKMTALPDDTVPGYTKVKWELNPQ